MKDVKQSIEDCEVMAGLQYTLYESYAILVLEQLKKSKDIDQLNEVLRDVKGVQKKAFEEWLRINGALSDMVKEEYNMDLLVFQLSSNSFANTERYRDIMADFKEEMCITQEMIASGNCEHLDDMIESLLDYVPQSRGSDFTLNIFIARG